MIDDKKIEAAANKHIETEYARYNSGEVEEEIVSWLNQHIFLKVDTILLKDHSHYQQL